MRFDVPLLSVVDSGLSGFSNITVRGPMRGDQFAAIVLTVPNSSIHTDWSGETWCSLTRTRPERRQLTRKRYEQCYRHLRRIQRGRCNGCGKSLAKPELDHYIPLSWGGPDDISNYQFLCRRCNRKKGAGSMIDLIWKGWRSWGFGDMLEHPYYLLG